MSGATRPVLPLQSPQDNCEDRAKHCRGPPVAGPTDISFSFCTLFTVFFPLPPSASEEAVLDCTASWGCCSPWAPVCCTGRRSGRGSCGFPSLGPPSPPLAVSKPLPPGPWPARWLLPCTGQGPSRGAGDLDRPFELLCEALDVLREVVEDG